MASSNNPQQSSAQPPADASLQDLIAQMSAVQLSNGPTQRTQQDDDLVATFKTLHPDAFDSRRPDVYLAMLDEGYKYVTECHAHVERDPTRLAFFLGGISRSFPGLFHRYTPTILDMSFVWASLFRDMAHAAMMGPFAWHPAARVVALCISPGPGRHYREGMRYREIWEAVAEREPRGRNDEVGY